MPHTPRKISLKGLSEERIAELVEQNEDIYDEYSDEQYTLSLEKNLFDYINRYYFRSRFFGFEPFPERNNPRYPLIFISNHSGMAFPWDGMVLGGSIFKLNGHQYFKGVRALAAPMLSQSTLMNPFLIPRFWHRVGGIDATSLNFETMMHFNRANVLIYPEGVPGIGKGFNNRYQLQRFSTSFVRMSLKYKTDVIPILTVNGEYINPYSYKIDWIDRLVQKIGVPFLPLSPITLLMLVQPWLFYFAFPARLTYLMGERIRPYEWTNKAYSEVTEAEVQAIRDRIQQTMQTQLTAAVEKYGQHPYHWPSFFWSSIRHFRRLPFFFSPGWPLLFAEHERLYNENGQQPVEMKVGLLSIVRVIVRNPFYLSFFIPLLGWIPILLKGYANHRLKE